MFGGDNMHNIKEWLNSLNVKVAAFLTPVAYTEYVIKMLFILKPKNLLKLFQIDLFLHIVCIILSIFIKPQLISMKSIILSAIISTLVLVSLIYCRMILKKKITKTNEDVKPNFLQTQFRQIKMPESLEVLLDQYNKKEEENKNG